MRKICHALSLICAFGWTAQGFGQVDSLNEPKSYDLDGVLIISKPTPHYALVGGREWTPDSTTIATAQMGNLSDLFREIPSISVKRYAPGGLSTPSFRGTGAGHTQIYWEGVPLNSPMLGQQDFALGGGALFEKVVVRYGGSSLQEGGGGLGGSINLKSSRDWPNHPTMGLKLRGQSGSFSSNSANIVWSANTRSLSATTKFYLQSASNNFSYRNTGLPDSPTQSLENAEIFQLGGMQELKYNHKNHVVGARIWLLRSQRNLPPTMLVQDAGEEQNDQALRSMVEWSAFQRKLGRLETKAAWFRESMQYRNQLAGIVAPSAFDRWLVQSDLDRYPGQHRIALQGAGIRYLRDQATTQGYSERAGQHILSAYAKGIWHIHQENQLTLLLRQERNGQQFSPLLGYLGGSTDFGVKGLVLKGNLSRNYRSPSLNDRFWIPGGNPNLQAEKSHAAELSIVFQGNENQDYASFGKKTKRFLTAELGGYYNDVQDWILWVPGSGAIWQPFNVQRVRAMGLEAIVKKTGHIGKIRYAIQANYTFASSKDQHGFQLIYTPQHIASLRLGLDWRGWTLQYFQDYNSKRYTVADNSAFLQGFTTADVTLGWNQLLSQKVASMENSFPQNRPLTKYHRHSVQLQVGLRNLGNAAYQTIAWRPMPGRSVIVRIDFNFAAGSPEKPQ